ncbi:OmpA family protein [Buchnera aphidicola]|jgi:OOP family OmpA-OmpF porin|uniref:Outer membrane protein A n=1 Tax=Buchnera aphidicola subsp. Schizaphis graminum (strain Sg) TaxID=198804 RepID=OMPA_BUCAP|nr:OmpA family protein [Buchnera aphidicola]Q8K9L4.1 RecName: Full=Outer membrane protein A; AltName: Full=Outer membrane porin A; Flags: Precursor [Buchnera aphidicola str. Sg (Schizaphis graminum)]AAM67874.1 outer membrane protein A precursor [Buchnera aphidicola str. Sg (Schizaphis graminum)]AWI49631.1 OmpA-like protein [Buchnera aphidicola (Schizaphis graminum)]
MKKQALTIIFLLVSLVTGIQAKENDHWYLGTKMGWSDFNILEYRSKDITPFDTKIDTKNPLGAPVFGLFLGYEFNPYFSFEIENDTTGFSPHLIFQKNEQNIQINSLQLATKLSYPITDDFHIYTQLGGMMFWDNLSFKKDLQNIFTEKSRLIPNVSLGAEYIFNKKFITRLDYTWKSNIAKIMNLSMKPVLGDVALSFGWKFGKSNINEIFSSYIPQSSDKQYVALNENINFPFNSTELKPISHDKLQKLQKEIKNIKSKNIFIMLSGHADRIGNKEYNQKLSENRAYSIKNYFTSHGISQDKISIQGMGNEFSLTNQICKDVSDRPLLISCLAPDRRVEIEVLSD